MPKNDYDIYQFPWWWRVDPPLEFLVSELGEVEKQKLATIQLQVTRTILQAQVEGIDHIMGVISKKTER